jgi:hypothetical protein
VRRAVPRGFRGNSHEVLAIPAWLEHATYGSRRPFSRSIKNGLRAARCNSFAYKYWREMRADEALHQNQENGISSMFRAKIGPSIRSSALGERWSRQSPLRRV